MCGLVYACALHAQSPDRISAVDISVRTLKPAEMPADTSGEWLEFVGPGVAFGALGVAAPPLYASGLVVGGILLGPGALILSDIDRRKWQRVADALQAVTFEQDLLRALRGRVSRAGLPAGAESVAVELTVNTFGVVGSMHMDRVCFISNVDLVIKTDGREIRRDRMNIAAENRSADAPPAQCASLGRFAEKDGQLVGDVAAEYVEVLAAMSVDRIKAALK